MGASLFQGLCPISPFTRGPGAGGRPDLPHVPPLHPRRDGGDPAAAFLSHCSRHSDAVQVRTSLPTPWGSGSSGLRVSYLQQLPTSPASPFSSVPPLGPAEPLSLAPPACPPLTATPSGPWPDAPLSALPDGGSCVPSTCPAARADTSPQVASPGPPSLEGLTEEEEGWRLGQVTPGPRISHTSSPDSSPQSPQSPEGGAAKAGV